MDVPDTARSDQLGAFQALLSKSPLLASLSRLVDARLIIDANIAIRDLRWMAVTRKNPEAQPETIEIVRTGLVKLYAPLFLVAEVRKYIPKIAKEAKKEEQEVELLWKEFANHIYFVDTSSFPPITDGRELRDPKDIPYVQLQEHLQLSILTKDEDIAAMGGKVIDIVVTKRLKQLYRTNAVEYQFASAGHIALCISGHAIEGLVKKIQTGFSIVRNAPPWVYIALAIILFAVLKDPKNRERISDFFEAIFDNAPELFEEVTKLAKRATRPYTDAKRKAADIAETLPEGLNTLEAKERSQ